MEEPDQYTLWVGHGPRSVHPGEIAVGHTGLDAEGRKTTYLAMLSETGEEKDMALHEGDTFELDGQRWKVERLDGLDPQQLSTVIVRLK